MSRSENRSLTGSMLAGLMWPIILGLLGVGGFYWMVLRGPWNHPLMLRYFTGHPVCIVETVFLFVCLAALAQKFWAVLGEHAALSHIRLAGEGMSLPISQATEWLDKLNELPSRFRNSYLGRRLIDALDSVERNASADRLDSELKHLSDLDSNRQQDSYALIRIIVWATPMLGFLGTVIGITQVIGDLAKQDLVNVKDAMGGLLTGLYVKFDTTALALSFTVVLMFIQFLIERLEIQVLEAVDRRAMRDLLGRFEVIGGASDPQIAAVQRVGQAVLKSTELLVQRQVELWQRALAGAHDEWARISRQSTEQMQAALGTALSQSLAQHAAHLAKSEQASAEQLTQRWEQWQTALSHNARLLHAQQVEMVKQGELMTQAIRAAGDVVQLERALNDNLSALSGAKNFEDTVMSLSAAIHLLNTRLGKSPDAPQVELATPRTRGRAA